MYFMLNPIIISFLIDAWYTKCFHKFYDQAAPWKKNNVLIMKHNHI